jgi:hypothetical protein|tara:strand:- start:2350 stop:3651 length:1302 start_codon:yes stop_codon:yes gene_type:complete
MGFLSRARSVISKFLSRITSGQTQVQPETQAPAQNFTPAPQPFTPATPQGPTAPSPTTAPSAQTGGMTSAAAPQSVAAAPAGAAAPIAPEAPGVLNQIAQGGQAAVDAFNQFSSQIPRFTPESGLDLIPGGAVGRTAVKAGGLGLLTTARNYVKQRSIKKLAVRTGKSEADITKLVNKAELKKGVAATVKTLDPKSLASKFIKGGLTIAGVDVIMQWYALDNAIGGQKFHLMTIAEQVETGGMDPFEAVTKMEESQAIRQVAIDKIELSTTINPLMWPFRNLVLAGVEGDENAIAESEARIQNAAANSNITLANPAYGTQQWWNKKAAEDEIIAAERQELYLQNLELEQAEWDRQRLDINERDTRLALLMEEDRLWWEERNAEQKILDEAERQYWEAKDARDEARRIAEEAYWEEQAQERDDSEPSRLGFGFL